MMELPPNDTLCGLTRDPYDEDEVGYKVTVLDEVTCADCQEMARRFPQLYNQLRAGARGERPWAAKEGAA